jgi:replicative DNA helicase
MKQLFAIIDTSIYVGEPKMEARMTFINKALEARVEKGFENMDIILNYCRSETYDELNEEIIISIPHYKKINYEEIKFINKTVEDRLRYYYVLLYKDRIYSAAERLDSGDFKTFEEINDEFLNLSTTFITQARKARTVASQDEFRLSDENFENNVKDIVERKKNPKRALRTGIQKLNELLSPAYIGGRTYVYLGTPGGFKSGLLLKTVVDIKRYNKGITGDNPEKRPTVLLVVMENSVDETIERWFNMCASNEDMAKFTPTQVVKILKESGHFSVSDASDIDVIIKYFPNRSITTDDLYTTIADLNDANSEVIALVFDYIKRIRPAERGKDEKEELKNITNELKSLALHYDIPVITAHQLNRDAAATVDSAMQANKSDLAKMLGRSQVGSALKARAFISVMIYSAISLMREYTR